MEARNVKAKVIKADNENRSGPGDPSARAR
jgi:hypothetical protein